MMRTSTAAGRAAVLAVLLAAAGCGMHHARTEHGAKSPATATTKAAGAAKDADSAASKAVAAVVARMDTKSSGWMVESERRGSRTVTLSGWHVWGSSGLGLDVTASPADFGMQNVNRTGRMEMIMKGDSEYLSIDPVRSGAFKGRHWLRYSETAVGGSALTDAMNKAGARNPIDALRAPAAAGRVALVGRETVDGKPTTHYHATVAADPAIVALKHVPATAQADVWVGQDGYPVRYVWDDGEQRNTFDFKSFGGARTIPTPPASDTIDTSRKPATNTATTTD
ncbi:hypothetical protein [Streptomyces sp. HPF1205]|uniref:hypothetical protein n=1 Tax=Streptomyces sp. HPF1205 TaxID=2873262 RepID=UPI001CECD818|nr:hypothetical protein [Streptomyces sp. HPF1205]